MINKILKLKGVGGQTLKDFFKEDWKTIVGTFLIYLFMSYLIGISFFMIFDGFYKLLK